MRSLPDPFQGVHLAAARVWRTLFTQRHARLPVLYLMVSLAIGGFCVVQVHAITFIDDSNAATVGVQVESDSPEPDVTLEIFGTRDKERYAELRIRAQEKTEIHLALNSQCNPQDSVGDSAPAEVNKMLQLVKDERWFSKKLPLCQVRRSYTQRVVIVQFNDLRERATGNLKAISYLTIDASRLSAARDVVVAPGVGNDLARKRVGHEFPTQVSWTDEGSAQRRDVWIIVIGAITGLLGTLLFEGLRPVFDWLGKL